MSLTDKVNIELRAGNGGNGVVRWRREKFIPRGGPAGGDGGRGGSVYLQGVKDNTKLELYTGKNVIKAPSGEAGGSKSLYGQNGDDIYLEVPVGTLVKNLDTLEEVDIINSEPVLLLRGGRGGLGNIHFKSSTNQTPKQQTDGKPGEAGNFIFELRLIADAGLIGLPSAGKSSLLNFLTNSKSRVAAYHFTTLEPHLGKFFDYILADIPGLIEGASQGKGLGHKFLQHIRRTQILLHCISLESDDLMSDYETIRNELVNFDPELGKKTEQVILTKQDLVDDEVIEKAKKIFPNAWVVSVLDDGSVKNISDKLSNLLENSGA